MADMEFCSPCGRGHVFICADRFCRSSIGAFCRLVEQNWYARLIASGNDSDGILLIWCRRNWVRSIPRHNAH